MKRVVAVDLSIGETCYVSPISALARDKLWEKSEKLFPAPDPTPFEVLIDDERSAIPGTKIPAKDNPEYKILAMQVMTQRNLWHVNQLIIASCHFDDEDALIEKYADELDILHDLDIELPDSKWEATLLYVLLQTAEDRRAVVDVIAQRGALTEVDKRDSLRIFRREIQPALVNGHPGEQIASGVEGEQVQPQRVTG